MFDNDLMRHSAEFNRYLANNQYEVTGEGIAFPKAGATAVGLYAHDINGGEVTIDKNMLVDEGLLYLLQVGLTPRAKLPNWYLALNGNNVAPSAGLKGAAYAATAGEITSQTEGYTEATRQLWNPDTNISGKAELLNATNRATFTMATASEVKIYGAALLSGNVRGSVADTLVSMVRFANPRTGYDTDKFNLSFRVALEQKV